MAGSAVSRRVSEFAGVTLFAVALIWFVAFATYSPADPVWFFNTGSDMRARELRRTYRRILAELSYQLLGYGAYLVPLVLAVIGWHYFWCHIVDAAYTKLTGAALLFSCVSSFLSLAFGALDISGSPSGPGVTSATRLASLLAAT